MKNSPSIGSLKSGRYLTVKLILLTSLATCLLPSSAWTQGLKLPPSGENQKASVTQFVGPVSITVDYSSPDVTGPQGLDRKGAIWGQLVGYGLNNLGFGPATEAPWRAGANENTTITISHDLTVQGEELAAGTYGFHVIPQESGSWTLIFSNNSTAWGSFFYDAKEDALRVEATPSQAPYREWLTYDFIDRQPNETTLALLWEEISLPFTFAVPDRNDLYMTSIRQELQNAPGFNWQNWNAAVGFALANNLVTDETLAWANTGVSAPFVGQENFTTLTALSQVQQVLGKDADSKATLDRALRHPTAGPIQLHTQARQLQVQGQTDRAIEIFKLNHERHGNVWPVNVGLARAYSAEGDYKKALEHAKLAVAEAPDAGNKQNLEQAVKILEQGKDFNVSN